MKEAHMLAFLLIVVGGINWGLVGLFNFNLVATVFASVPVLEQVTYIAVGVAAVYAASQHLTMCKVCSTKK